MYITSNQHAECDAHIIRTVLQHTTHREKERDMDKLLFNNLYVVAIIHRHHNALDTQTHTRSHEH